MTVAVSMLPEQQLAVLNDAYRKAVARKRLRVTLATAVFFAALVVAAIGAEVNLGNLRQQDRKLRQLFRSHRDAGKRRAGVVRCRRVVLGLAEVAVDCSARPS